MNIENWFHDASRHKQGIIGELQAKLILTYLGYDCATPDGIHVPYDLLAVKDGVVSKIQVKTSNSISGGTDENPRYSVFIATSGGNTKEHSRKGFDPTLIDFLFVMVGDGDCWLIPASEITAKDTLFVGTDKYKQYKL